MKGLLQLKLQYAEHHMSYCRIRFTTLPKIVILGRVSFRKNGLLKEPSLFYQAVAISICVGFRLANVPVSHTIPIPSDVCTSEPLGLIFRLAATIT